MFCQKCGKEISDNTKFCNFCGAEQNAATTMTNETQNINPTSKNSTKLIIIIAVAAVALILGIFIIAPTLSGDKDDTPIDSPSKVTDNVDKEDNISAPAVSDDVSDTILESLIPENSDDRSGDVYSASLGEGGIFTLSFGYYRESPKVLYDFTGSIEVEKTNASYNELKKECEKFEKRANELNDSDNVRIKCKENDKGIEVLLYIDKLADADRKDRVDLAADFIGIKDTDGAFYFDSVISQLTEIGFERGIPN